MAFIIEKILSKAYACMDWSCPYCGKSMKGSIIILKDGSLVAKTNCCGNADMYATRLLQDAVRRQEHYYCETE